MQKAHVRRFKVGGTVEEDSVLALCWRPFLHVFA